MLHQSYLWDHDQPKISSLLDDSLNISTSSIQQRGSFRSVIQPSMKKKFDENLSDNGSAYSANDTTSQAKKSRKDTSMKAKETDNTQELSNHEYFQPIKEGKIDFIIDKVRVKPQKGSVLNATQMVTSFTNFIRRSIARKPAEPTEEDKAVAAKKTQVGWTDITASCVIEDTLILGFGNGALACLDTKKSIQKEESITHLELNFSGEEDHHIEKLRTLAIDGLFNESEEGAKKHS